ncbi:hypothetical protein DID78_04370 [Candidatus Marinamargulisbacteria bacterium SCGC AG-343-D04]|nr:hypothetical protein DID78_04370 [Candidatus Marinamargulisbacteria bacterium SCGC AG-343-D04]
MICRLFFLLFFFSTSLLFSYTEYKDVKIDFNQHSSTLNISLLSQDNVLYFPLFEIKKLIPRLSIRYSHKQDGYFLKSSSTELFVVNRSSEVWVNKSIHFFESPTFYHHSTLYVPMKDLFRFFNISTSIPGDMSSKQRVISLENKALFTTSSSPYATFHSIKSDSSLLPKRLSPELSIRHQHISYPLKDRIQERHDIYFVEAKDLLLELGYQVTVSQNIMSLAYNDFTYSIPLNSRLWSMASRHGKWEFMAERSLYQEGDRVWFPLRSLFTFLDYSIDYNSFSSSLDLLSNIHAVEVNKGDKFSKFTIISRHPVKTKEFSTSDSSLTQSFIVNYATSFAPIRLKPTTEPLLSSITMKNINYTYEQTHQKNFSESKKNVLIQCEFTQPLILQAINQQSGTDLQINTVLNEISLKPSLKSTEIIISGVHINPPSIIKEKNKLIMDFPETLNSLPQLKRVNSNEIISIRSSQLSQNPLVTRVVIDFKEKIPEYKRSQKKDIFKIKIPSTPTIKTKPVVASSKKRHKKKRSTSKRTLKNKVIIVDAGHGGADPGAVYKTIYEKNYTLDIALKLKTLLEKEGAYVIMTRKSDASKSLHRRIRIANNNKADLFLSVHLNSFTSKKAHGSATYYYKHKDKKLAYHIQKQLKRDLKLKSNGVKRGRFFVLRNTKMPASLVEPLFITNPKEKKLLTKPEYREKIARSLFQGLKNYFKYN